MSGLLSTSYRVLDMNGVQGWISMSYTEKKAVMSQSFGCFAIPAIMKSSASVHNKFLNFLYVQLKTLYKQLEVRLIFLLIFICNLI